MLALRFAAIERLKVTARLFAETSIYSCGKIPFRELGIEFISRPSEPRMGITLAQGEVEHGSGESCQIAMTSAKTVRSSLGSQILGLIADIIRRLWGEEARTHDLLVVRRNTPLLLVFPGLVQILNAGFVDQRTGCRIGWAQSV